MLFIFEDQKGNTIALHPLRVEGLSPHGEMRDFRDVVKGGTHSYRSTVALVTTASGYTHVTRCSFQQALAEWQKVLRTWVPAISSLE